MRKLFFSAVKGAKAHALYEALVTINAHAVADRPGRWTAAAWFRERRYPQHLG
jgi:hypothetical protein